MSAAARRKPPATRRGITAKLELAGVNVYTTLNRDAEGHPCDLFITLNNESQEAPIDPGHQAWANLAATLASICMQHHASLETVAAKFRGYAFEPAGHLGRGNAKSIPDAIGRWLDEQATS